MQMLIVTDSAQNQISEVLVDGGNYVRAFIEGGGCSGFNYGFSIEDTKEDDDFVIGQLIVDSMSMQYFTGATIDYISDRLKGSQFTINNPNAKSTCGCGSSFAV
jgi:iron-sulfur cluster insertion protein